jgi:hypothetical protein
MNPLIFLVEHETPQICFQALVGNFSFPMNFGMIGHAEMQLDALEPRKLFQKVSCECWITFEENRVGHSMEFEDILYQNLSHDGCYKCVLEGKK